MANVSFQVKDLAGKVIRTGVTDENLLDYQIMNDGETVEIVDPEAKSELSSDANEIVTYSHQHPRMVNYPSEREQLDVLWKIVKENCSLSPEQKLMLDRIEAVKDQFPKDQLYIKKADGSFVPYDSNPQG